ncbi:MAG: amidohydrolase, partial [Alphaproteobacteria bacterium]|nr:amidohydrolase [Alphaproteobacteria bacterium]
MKFLTDEQLNRLLPAETSSFASPVPTQIVSSDEYLPVPQTERQREVEARLKELSGALAKRQGLSRRRFFQTAAGMAASFVAMNEVFGRLFEVSEAEAATPDLADALAKAKSGQMVIDGHTHFLRDDTRLMGFVAMRNAVGKSGWNKQLTAEGEQTIDDLKFGNYVKEIYMDSDTKVALLSNSPSEVPEDWFIPQEQVFKTREQVNKEAGSRRMMAHFTITPGWPGWLDQVDKAIEVYKPDSWKGYTVGDNTHKELAHYPYRLDDEKLMYPFYEKAAKSGIKNVCIHKGLFAPAVEEKFPQLRPHADVNDVGKAAKDWPQLNFLIYHSGYRWIGAAPADGMA